MVQPLIVPLGSRSYPIHFGADLTSVMAAELATLQAAGQRVAVVTDERVAAAQSALLDALFPSLPRLVLAAGEETKSLAGFGQVVDFLAAERLDRSSSLIAVGGGVIGDLAGFAAAAYLRGITFYQVPTTLLAMVDSSVGGKTGINLAAGKNLVGAFHQPRAVYIATDLLRTLPPREFAAGMAEVIKYGLLGDAELFAELVASPLTAGSSRLAAVIRRCCAAKARVVEADEFETAAQGGRALLNLGHTFGHAIENAAGYGTYLHGEAVAIGLAAAVRLSHRLGLLDAAVIEAVEGTLQSHRLPTRLGEPLPLDHLLQAMGRDKKVRAGRRRFVVLSGVGAALTRDDVDPAAVEAVWREIGAG
jgi:3-dehydroquinate synthase